MYRGTEVFREEAVLRRSRSSDYGQPLRISPRWVGAVYWLVMVVSVAAIVFVSVADLGEYAEGPALVRVDGHTVVVARSGGVLGALDAEPGRVVRRGEVLARVGAASDAAEVERLEAELEAGTVAHLRHPNRGVGSTGLASIRAQLESARTRLAQHTIVAPHAGRVSDVRVAVGQRVEPGQGLVTIEHEHRQVEVLAIVPGAYRPLLHRGMPLQLELEGFSAHREVVPIETIDAQVIGPNEVRRVLGASQADAVSISGAAVLVRATVDDASFIVDGRELSYFDGMSGRAEIRVREQSVLTSLLPGLSALEAR